MGMTIDEYIKRMGDIRSNYDRWSGLGLTPNEAKAFDMAIDTMHKYQKIVQIVENVDKRYYGYSTMMDYLHEVIQDGND